MDVKLDMFAMTHIYAAQKINPDADLMFLYGAIFPDLPVTKVIQWEVMQSKTEEFSNYVKSKDKEYLSFANGLLVHENPFGIDRFVHGLNNDGYAFKKGESLIHDVKKLLFPGNFVMQTIAYIFFRGQLRKACHSFIEFSIEMQIAQKHPQLIDKIKKVQLSARKNEKNIAKLFSNYFRIPITDAQFAIAQFNDFLIYDISSEEKAVSTFTSVIKFAKSFEVEEDKVKEILRMSLIKTKDYNDYLDEFIRKCQKDYIHH